MTPLHLELVGFAGIQSGLGVDRISLDLRSLPDSARLIALTGPNGIGKSTLLDNLHPYRTMPSRHDGEAGTAFSYYEHLCRPEAAKTLLWSYRGCLYRSRLLFRTGGRRKSDCFLHVRQGDKWVPFRTPNGVISDGRAETYDACVESILGSATLFFTAHFAAQRRRSLIDYSPGEFKALLSNMLGLDQILELQRKAGETVRLLRTGLGTVRTQRMAYADELSGLLQTRQALGDVDALLAQATSALAAARAAVSGAQHHLASVREQQALLSGIQERRQALVQTIEQMRLAHGRALDATMAQRRLELARIDDIERSVARRRQDAASRLAEAQARLQRLQALAASEASVRRAARRLPMREKILALRRQRCDALDEQRSRAQAACDTQRGLRAQIESVERSAGQAALRVEDLKRRGGLTDAVPCAGTDLGPRCQLLRDAHAAASMVPSAEAELGRLAQARATLREQIRALGDAEGVLMGVDGALSAARARLRRCEEGVRRTAVVAARLDEVTQAAESVAAARRTVDELTRAQTAGPTDEESLAMESARNAAERLEQESRALAREHREQIAAVQAQLDALPTPPDPQLLAAAMAALAQAEARLAAAEADYAGAVRAKQQADDLDTQIRARGRAEACAADGAARIETELSWWQTLARGLGPDGIVALCIDDAGPALASLTNALLLACYGPRFTVSIATQCQTRSGEMREGFEVIVHDGADGTSKRLRHLSGGEQIWIGEALKRAIALYVAQAGGYSHETLFSDETDGPLDPERKRMFLRMKHEVLRLGGYRREFFVSQSAELTAMADAAIDVAALAGSCAGQQAASDACTAHEHCS